VGASPRAPLTRPAAPLPPPPRLRRGSPQRFSAKAAVRAAHSLTLFALRLIE